MQTHNVKCICHQRMGYRICLVSGGAESERGAEEAPHTAPKRKTGRGPASNSRSISVPRGHCLGPRADATESAATYAHTRSRRLRGVVMLLRGGGGGGGVVTFSR